MKYFIILFVFYSSRILLSQELNKELTLSIGENFRIYPSNMIQWEPSITNHPYNEDIIFVSANTLSLNPFFISEGIYVTTDGGINWMGNDTCTGIPITSHGGDPGIIIDKDGVFILTRKGFSEGIYSHYSTNLGQSWSNQKTITSDDAAPEKAGLVSDVNPSNTFFGRTYVAWVKQAPPFPLTFVYTDDSGINWSIPQQINNPSQRCFNNELSILPDGKLFLSWATLTNTSPFTEDYVGFATSTNGGVTWEVDENIYDINGISGLLPEKGNIRINGLPRMAVDTSDGLRYGWIYIVTGQKNLSPAGSDPDVILNRSSDGGQTWSQGIRVNQDPLNNGKIQLFPAVHVDNFGGVNVIFYDDRNTTTDSLGMFLARSDDGGDTWREFEISDHNFKPTPLAVFQGKMGDNIGITSANGKIWPVWMDNSTGNYQIWTVPIEISSVGVDDQAIRVSEFQLDQNYPNPFNPTTKISWQTKSSGWQTLKVYDVMGNEIMTLVDEYRTAGKHEINFTAKSLPSGIYFYQLRAGNFSETRKMILIK